MSSKVNLLKKQIAEVQALLEVEMAKNANVSDGKTAYTYRKEKTIVERLAPNFKDKGVMEGGGKHPPPPVLHQPKKPGANGVKC